ncbi:MAG: hypothetical protein RIG26_01110 [Thalassospira sp.]|uniref:hypothetical protein n=1 Tax=Thalassospira sp. TaxID=1912094 RepID=UPI0032EEF983
MSDAYKIRAFYGRARVIGENRKEKSRYWFFILLAALITVSGQRLLKFLPAPQELAFDEFNKRCIANIEDFSQLVHNEEIAPYRVNQARVETTFPNNEFRAWQYEHKAHSNAVVVLTVDENSVCTLSMSEQSLDTTRATMEGVMNGRIKQLDVPPKRPGLVSYVLFDEANSTRLALIVLAPISKGDLELGISLIKPLNGRFSDGTSLDDYTVIEP